MGSFNIVTAKESKRGKYTDHTILSKNKSQIFYVRVMKKGEGCTGFWWGKPDGKRPLGRPRRRWEDNINMDLQEVGGGFGGLDGVGSG